MFHNPVDAGHKLNVVCKFNLRPASNGKLDHYGNVNCVFTRVYASLSNKYRGINFLATLSDGLSFNINTDSFSFKWKLLEALPIKLKPEESAW